MQFSTLCSSKMETFKPNFFGILAIHNDQISYVKNVLDALYVFFHPILGFGRGWGALCAFECLCD